jgi:hypothetical protein
MRVNLFMGKDESIKRLKLLIKKYHPDLCYDENLKKKYTEITIRLNDALTRLMRSSAWEDASKRAAPAPPGKPQEPVQAQRKGPLYTGETRDLKTLGDQGYAWYRQGIKYWRRIHPDRFYKKAYISSSIGAFPEHVDLSSKEKTEVIKDILNSFKWAKYFFTHVLEECADSPWVFDAKRRLRILERLELIYKQWI